MKVAQSCLTLCDPMDCSLPGSSCPWNSTDKNGVGNCSLLQGIFPIRGSNTGLLHCRWILYHLSLVDKLCPILGDPMESGCQAPLSMGFSSQEYRQDWVAMPSSRGSSTQGSNLCLLHWQVGSLPLSHQGGIYNLLEMPHDFYFNVSLNYNF